MTTAGGSGNPIATATTTVIIVRVMYGPRGTGRF